MTGMTDLADVTVAAVAAPERGRARVVPRRVLAAKRALDIGGSLAGLALLGAPMVAIAVWIRIDSPGPALYTQTRAGLDGRHFRCWKFRTMRVGADDERERLRAEGECEGATFKLADDPRITRAGRYLRRYSLDELPQLLNVLAGDMSLVGPRPHPLDDVDRYTDDAFERLSVLPGMTGPWQVGGRSTLEWIDGLMLDVLYARTWTVRGDLAILTRTVPAVVRGIGAW